MAFGIMEAFSIGSTALGIIGSHNAASASAKYQRAQQAWNDKQNLKRARVQGMALDTNMVRARTETAVALQGIQSSEKEAVANSRVAAAAANMGAGSYDTLLNTFARKSNQAEGNTIQQLVAELVQDQISRQDIAVQATAGMSSNVPRGPSVLASVLNGATDYFKSTYGLKGAFDFGGSSGGNVSGGIDFFSTSSGPGITFGTSDPFKGILDF